MLLALVACPRSRPIFNTQRRRRLQQAPRRRRSLLHLFAARLLQIPPRSSRFRRAGGRKHGQRPPRLGIERHRQAEAGGTGGNRNALGGQRSGSGGIHNASTPRVGEARTDGSSRAIVAWRGNLSGGRGRGSTKGGGVSSGGGGTASMSSTGWGAGLAIWGGRPWRPPR